MVFCADLDATSNCPSHPPTTKLLLPLPPTRRGEKLTCRPAEKTIHGHRGIKQILALERSRPHIVRPMRLCGTNSVPKALGTALYAAIVLCLNGCVTGKTIEAAREHVHYKPQKVEDGKITPLEVESVEKAKPGYYALLPLTVAADIALIPVYVGVVIAVNVGIMKQPF